MQDLHIVCTRAGGMNRGGVRHPEGRKAHKLEHFAPAQLREMLADPSLELVIGEPLTEERIDDIEAKLTAAEAKKAKS